MPSVWSTVRAQPMIRSGQGVNPVAIGVHLRALACFAVAFPCLLPARDCQFVDAGRGGPTGQGGPVASGGGGVERVDRRLADEEAEDLADRVSGQV